MRDDHPSPGRVEAFLADELPADEARAVDDHLADCEACAEVSERSEPPVALDPGAPPTPAWDERRMRRAVRRTLWRTAVDVIAIVGVTLIAGQLVIAFVWHPVAVDRDDRVERHVRAAVDLPVLTGPGTHVTGFVSNTSGLSRVTEVDVARTVGGRVRPLGTREARLGALSASGPVGMPDEPTPGGGPSGTSHVGFEPDRLPQGTAVAVELTLPGGVEVDEVDALLVDDEVALTWVGFGRREVDSIGSPVGYSTCLDTSRATEHVSGTGGFGGSGLGDGPPEIGARHALAETGRALDNLAAADVRGPGPLPDEEVEELAAAIADDRVVVTRAVVTGPSAAVAEAVERADPQRTELLDVDHDVGPPTPCGWSPRSSGEERG